ncbi:MAG: mechanosensitive ion channel family protein [Candidatus Cloacimonetes bacterium]|nr:mechanosensitive ion channel family protein [Candidatus Cloacimonadota bacterium]
MINLIEDWLLSLGLQSRQASVSASIISIIILLSAAWIAYIFTNAVILHYLKKIFDKTRTNWDNIFYDQKVFSRLSHLVPAFIIYFGVILVLPDFPRAVAAIQTAAYLYILITALIVIDALLNAIHKIYNTMPAAKDRSIKSFVQVIKIFVYILGFGIFVSIIFDKDLTSFFTGLGAMAAVIMLIFKDTILGFVAGIQLSANDMVSLGDWVEMPSRNADGVVIDISLNTVKIQNWDRTISTIPPYALITESFTNWRGMEESGGRRIKRSLNIDLKSIHFLNAEDLEKLKEIELIREYIETREKEVAESNKLNKVNVNNPVNGRRLTNIGTFRKYVEEYLKRHPQIHNDMTFLVRQLQPTEKGLPLEIYVFCKDQRWAYYESIQADIFDHLLAVIPQFSLSLYQYPGSDDLRLFVEKRILGDQG